VLLALVLSVKFVGVFIEGIYIVIECYDDCVRG
jgi:dolichyl-phosphate-mannose--protein O-mannosyl transferase